MKIFKKILAVFLAAILFSGGILTACNPPEKEKIVSSIAIKSGTYQTSYLQNETPDFSALKVTLTYNDKTNKDIGLDDENLTVNTNAITTAQTGTKKLRAAYTDPVNGITHNAEEVEISVNYNPQKFVKSIAFNEGMATSYMIGDTLALGSIELIATLEDATTQILQSNMFTLNTEAVNMNEVGTYPIVATYVDVANNSKILNASANITVSSPILVDPDKFVKIIEFDETSIVIEYIQNTAMPTFSGARLIAELEDGTTRIITRYNFSIDTSEIDMSDEGSFEIVATYYDTPNGNAEHTACINIHISASPSSPDSNIKTVSGLKTGSYKTFYEIGEKFEYQNFVLEVTLDDESETEIAYGDFSINTSDFVDASGKIKGVTGVRRLTATIAVDGGDDLTFDTDITITEGAGTPNPNEFVASIGLKAGTYQSNYTEGEILAYKNILIVGTLESGSSVEFAYPEFSVVLKDKQTSQSVNFQALVRGNYILTVTYIDKKNNNEIHTVNADITVKTRQISPSEMVYGYELPQSFEDYDYNKGNKVNAEEQFMNQEQSYKVGTLNEFVFFPEVTKYKDSKPYIIDGVTETFESDVRIFDISDGSAEATEVSQNTAIVEFDATNGRFNFKAAAINKKYRIEQKIADTDYAAFPSLGEKVVSMEIEVIEGFNVHNVKQFSIIDNSETTGNNRWVDYKTNNGVPVVGTDNFNNITAAILHSNIKITASDLPQNENFLWNDGSLKDQINIYGRSTPVQEEFKLIGNYYTIDASQLPLITHENDSETPVKEDTYIISNTNLIGFGGGYTGVGAGPHGVSSIESATLLGNTPRGTQAEYTGGMKIVEGAAVEIYNIIARDFYSFLLCTGKENQTDPIFDVTYSRFYNSFASMALNWNHSNVSFNYCEMKRSGGPIVQGVHSIGASQSGAASLIPHITITNSVTEALLSGEEIWFQSGGGGGVAIANSLKQCNNLFTTASENISQLLQKNVNKSFLVEKTQSNGTKQYANIIGILTPENLVIEDSNDNLGSIIVDGYELNTKGTAVNGFKNLPPLEAAWSAGAPIFQSNFLHPQLGYIMSGAMLVDTAGTLKLNTGVNIDNDNWGMLLTGNRLSIYNKFGEGAVAVMVEYFGEGVIY